MNDRLLSDPNIQTRWEFFEPVTFDMMLRAWRNVRRYLARERAFRSNEEPVLRATLHYEDLVEVRSTMPREWVFSMDISHHPKGTQCRLNGMLLAPTRHAMPGHAVLELLSIRGRNV